MSKTYQFNFNSQIIFFTKLGRFQTFYFNLFYANALAEQFNI